MSYYGSYSSTRSLRKSIDWWIIIAYLVLTFTGWISIYASIHNDDSVAILDWGSRSGKQLIWIVSSLGLAALVLFVIPPRTYETLSPLLYGIVGVLLIAVIFIGGDVKGSHSWFTFGPISFQPAEISKITTSLLLATVMSRGGFRLRGRGLWAAAAIILLPMLIIICEKETGSALVYIGFIFMLYREGLSGWLIAVGALAILVFILTIVASPFVGILVLAGIISLVDCILDSRVPLYLCIGVPLIVGVCFLPEGWKMPVLCSLTGLYAAFSLWKAVRGTRQSFRRATLTTLVAGVVLVFSAGFVFNNVLKDYQKNRIEVLLGMKEDIAGAGYNVHQSKIAIGSGGFTGKGFLKGTQTAYGFVPEQSTDFIFCTVGEEAGFLGCLFVLAMYFFLITRIVRDSERSREAFTRIYGYCLAGCLTMHLFINVGMTLGLMPVIGIPLPFMSYGGSSMWAFTIMLFIFVALDKNERKYF